MDIVDFFIANGLWEDLDALPYNDADDARAAAINAAAADNN